MAPL
ncbi:hypothetical protein LINGRAHAP2_LOCUS4276 [Linum grandiflorum]|jgi:hypothetical protein